MNAMALIGRIGFDKHLKRQGWEFREGGREGKWRDGVTHWLGAWANEWINKMKQRAANKRRRDIDGRMEGRREAEVGPTLSCVNSIPIKHVALIFPPHFRDAHQYMRSPGTEVEGPAGTTQREIRAERVGAGRVSATQREEQDEG